MCCGGLRSRAVVNERRGQRPAPCRGDRVLGGGGRGLASADNVTAGWVSAVRSAVASMRAAARLRRRTAADRRITDLVDAMAKAQEY